MADQAPQATTPPPQVESPGSVQVDHETENFLAIYQITADWIRFADAKATVVLTVSGALASLLIPSLHDFLSRESHIQPWWPQLTLVFFCGWLLFMGLSGIWAFLCIQPVRRKGKHPALDHCSHFHGAAIANHYKPNEVDRFIAESNRMGMDGLRKEVQAGILIDAHISNTKYNRVARSIRLLAISAVFALLYALAIQF